ncbi:hypothetical protein D3C86_2168230 [compost metagenome]
MMLCNNFRIITYHENSTYRESANMLTFWDPGFLEQMQASAPTADEHKFSRMALRAAAFQITNL